MINMNKIPPAAPPNVAYRFAKNNRKKMTAATAMIIAAGQYAQRRRERYENHVEVVMKSGIAHINIAPRPMYCWDILAKSHAISTMMRLSIARISAVLQWV